MNRINETYNDTTGEFALYSKLNGEQLFFGRVKSKKRRADITRAVRRAESITKYITISNSIQNLELLYDK